MLIGLCGFARVGKDTTFTYIKEQRPEAQHLSFARALKESATASLGIAGWDPIHFCNELKELGRIKIILDSTKEDAEPTTWELSGREFLQNYGTEAHRNIFGDLFWIDQVLPKGFDHTDRVCVVNDVRFQNEAERVKELGGAVWKIRRPEVKEANAHASEVEIPEHLVDLEIENDGTLEELREKVITIFNPLEQGVVAPTIEGCPGCGSDDPAWVSPDMPWDPEMCNNTFHHERTPPS